MILFDGSLFMRAADSDDEINVEGEAEAVVCFPLAVGSFLCGSLALLLVVVVVVVLGCC